MKRPELSVCLDDLQLQVREALDRARWLGFRAVDVSATEGPISPGELARSGQRHLLRHLDDLGLRLGSLRGPVAGPGYGSGADGERRLETMLGVMRIASALGVPVVATSVAGGGADRDDRWGREVEALTMLANDADRLGVIVAVETAGVGTSRLRQVLSEINCPNLAVCCDSGAMLAAGEDPHSIADTLPGRIKLVRARDAVAGEPGTPGYEVAIGEGQLDPPRFLAALSEAGFTGDIVVARTGGRDAEADIRKGREVLAQLVGGPGALPRP